MSTLRAGETIDYRITWLEMATRPAYGWPPLPETCKGELVKAENPPWWWFLTLSDAVGRDYAWTDKHALGPEQLNAWIQQPDVEIWTLMERGWPHGFFMLDWTEAGTCDLAYFGLVPEAVGRGLGTWLLKTAVLKGWARGGVQRMTVNTCTMDHPRALPQYERVGFAPIRRTRHSRVLRHDQTFLQPLL